MRRSRSDGRADRGTAGPGALLAALLSVAPACVAAQAAPDAAVQNSGALFLLFPVGAQAVGMGQTAVALDGRGEAAFWNPAGLASIAQNEFALHSANLAAGNTNAVTFFVPSHGLGVVGGAIYLVDYGDQDVNDSSGLTIARIAPRNIAVSASYAAALSPAFTFGLTYKLIEFRVDCSGDCSQVPAGLGVTHALDVGGQVSVGPRGALRVGLAVRNIGFRLQVNNRDQADALPVRVAIGAIYTTNLHPLAGASDAERFDVRLAADLDSPWGEVGSPAMRLGVDVGYQHLVRVRGGYAFSTGGLRGPSIGLGVTSGAIGVDLARPFLEGSGLVTPNPTFISFRVVF